VKQISEVWFFAVLHIFKLDHDGGRLEMMDQFFQPQRTKFSSHW
jgi:hypothetical protein